MTFELRMRDNYKNGRTEGLAEGIAQGRSQAEAKAKEEKAQSVKALYENHVSIETIAKCTFITEAEVQNILSAK